MRKGRQVLGRVKDVVKVLGKRGLSYRQVENEAAYTFDDNTIHRGNFMELILLLAKYDVCLWEHVHDCIEKSKRLSTGTRVRGSLITLLCKMSVNSVIDTLGRLVQESIASDVHKAGMFSVQLDATQDITGHDQCSVILHERLFAVVKRHASTRQDFVDSLSGVWERLKLDKAMCIGNATDGASNMKGHYKDCSSLSTCVVLCT